MTGILPLERIEPTLGDLAVGQSAWTVSWAMDIDQERRSYLNPAFCALAEPGGTVDMLVTRMDDGWVVDISRSRGTWRPDSAPRGEPVVMVIAPELAQERTG